MVSNPTVVIISDSVYSSDTSGEVDISPGEVSSDVLSRVVIGAVVASSSRKDSSALGDDGTVVVCSEIVVSSVWTVDADIVVCLRGVVGSGLVVSSMEVVSSVVVCQYVDIGSVVVGSDSSVNKRRKTPHT